MRAKRQKTSMAVCPTHGVRFVTFSAPPRYFSLGCPVCVAAIRDRVRAERERYDHQRPNLRRTEDTHDDQ